MKRSIDTLAGRSSPPSSPPSSAPSSPRRRRLDASSSAGPSELHRPDDAPSSRAPSASGLDESSARRAGVLPLQHGAATLADVPRNAFAVITQHLDESDHMRLAMADPRSLAPRVADELAAARIARTAARVASLDGFTSLLGAGAHARADTVLSIDGRPRGVALTALVRNVVTLPEEDRFPAFALAAQAAHEMAANDRTPVVGALLRTLEDVPVEQRHDAWHAFLGSIETPELGPGTSRLALMETWIGELARLRADHRNDAAQTAFDAVERLPLAHRAPMLLVLVRKVSTSLRNVEPRIVKAGLDAIARLPVDDHAGLLGEWSSVIAAMPSVDPQPTSDSDRRTAVRALRQAIAALPAEQRSRPLAALASTIEHLPLRERHLEMHVFLREIERLAADGAPTAHQGAPLKALNAQIAHLPADARAAAWRSAKALSLALGRAVDIEPWETLMDQVEHMEPGRRLGMLRDTYAQIAPVTEAERERPAPAYARIAPVTDAERGRLLPALLPPRRLGNGPPDLREGYFVQGGQLTALLPPEHRSAALSRLAVSIRDLPVEAFERATTGVMHAITSQPIDRLVEPFNAFVEAVGGLALAGLPQGFELVETRIDAQSAELQPLLMVALALGIHHWPAAGLAERFRSLANAAFAQDESTTGSVLAALTLRTVCLPIDERVPFMGFALHRAPELPDGHRVAAYLHIVAAMHSIPAGDRPRMARDVLAAVLALSNAYRLPAFHEAVRTFGVVARHPQGSDGFGHLLEAFDTQPAADRELLIKTLFFGLATWPSAGQERRFAAVCDRVRSLPSDQRLNVLYELGYRLKRLPEEMQPAATIAVQEAMRQDARDREAAQDEPIPF